MSNRLCDACMNTCRQESSAKIVRCPNFRKRLTEDQFRARLNEIDDAESRAADLSRRVKELIARAVSGKAGEAAQASGASGEAIGLHADDSDEMKEK